MEQIKRIPVNINVFQFLITFSYKTRKGNYKEQQRIINDISKENAKEHFKQFIENNRTMFNGKILSIVEIEENKQVIAI